MVDTLWTCPKSHIDGQNHKNTCFRQAIFHKRPSRRARPSIVGPLGHTAILSILFFHEKVTFFGWLVIFMWSFMSFLVNFWLGLGNPRHNRYFTPQQMRREVHFWWQRIRVGNGYRRKMTSRSLRNASPKPMQNCTRNWGWYAQIYARYSWKCCSRIVL